MKMRKRIAGGSLLKAVACMALFLLAALGPVSAYAGETQDYTLAITNPGKTRGTVTPGHGFFISGTIQALKDLPEKAALRVSVLNESGEEVRFAECSEKDRNVVDRFCDAIFYYAQEANPERTEINAWNCPFLIVEDEEKPEESLKNASIKCWFSQEEFNAFIPYATDVSRGLIFDDGIGFTDAQGEPLTALPDGTYTAMVQLKDGEGEVLASVEKEFDLTPVENSILCRFHPDAQYECMLRFAKEKELFIAADHLPGYLEDCQGSRKGGARAMFIGGDVALYRDSRVTMFEYIAGEDSYSLTVELPYLEKYFDIEDPEKFTVYHYDIGEPSIVVQGEKIEGTPVEVQNGDKLSLCRADMVIGGREGYLDFSSLDIQETDLSFSDGVTLKANKEGQMAIAGLVVPYQLKDEEILFDLETNETGLLNRVANIEYLVWDGAESVRYQKPVTLTRKFEDGSEYGSVMEFYHLFSKEEIDPEGEYVVVLWGTDLNGERVEGTRESFVVNSAPQARVEGLIKAEGINKFGNVSLGISREDFLKAGFLEGDLVSVQIGDLVVDVPFVIDYTDVQRGQPLLVSQSEELALWVSMGSFAEVYEIAVRGEQTQEGVHWDLSGGENGSLPVVITMKEKAGYLAEYELRRSLTSMKPSPEQRPDQTLEEFANFRAVTTTGIRADTLYRSSSPIDDRDGRREAAEECLEKYGIDHILNLYNTREEAEAMKGYWDSQESKLDTVFINVSLDYTSSRFGEKMAAIMNYLADNEGKFLLHCILGEHRTGAVCMVLSALMGASYEEIKDDYMQTCINLYDVKPGTKQYDLILDDNVNAVLKLLFHAEDPGKDDLKSLAKDYILSTGISEEVLERVMAHLGE